MLQRKKISFDFEGIQPPTGRLINSIITALVVISSAIFVIETYSISANLRDKLNLINYVILLIFTIEYLFRFWYAEKKVQYFLNIYSLIDLIVIIPFLIVFIDNGFILIFKWFIILRLLKFLDPQVFPSNINMDNGLIFARIIVTLFSIVFIYSGLIYQVEHTVNSKVFRTFLDAFYFSVVTMTTVGFGDITPISELGRLLTVVMIFTGVSLIPWQVGDLIKRLVKTANQVEIPCRNCNLYLHDKDAIFCKNCGNKLEKG